jgi:hypothetical protein
LRAVTAILFIGVIITACTQRVVCPAYQSAFIYDKEDLRKRFSYFENDTVPKVLTASKTKYLIAEPTTYKKKTRSLQTVPMKPVYVNVPDSLREGAEDFVSGAELDRAARSIIDSIYIEPIDDVDIDSAATDNADSVYVITKDREVRVLKYTYPDSLVLDPVTGKMIPAKPAYVVKHIGYNVQQDNYMWYLRQYLILPDVRLAKLTGAAKSKESSGDAKKEKKGIGGFFKNLFKKKDKAPEPEEAPIIPKDPNVDFDYVDEEEQRKQAEQALQQNEEPAKKKKQKKEKVPKEKKSKKEDAAEEPAEETPVLDEDGF